MGVDPLTIGLIGSGAASLYGAVSGGRAQSRAQNQAQQRYNELSGMVQGQMQNGPNPYAQAISGMFGGSDFSIPTAPGVNVPSLLDRSGFNAGQDGFLQSIRRSLGPTTNPDLALGLQHQAQGVSFDNSQIFQALQSQDAFNTEQGAGALRAQAHSLGQLAGSPMQNAEATYRAQVARDTAQRNAQIGGASFESAQGRALQAMGLMGQQEQALNQFNLGAYQAQNSAYSAYGQNALQAAGLGLQGEQFNAGQANQMAQYQRDLQLRALMGAGGLQQGQQAQNAQLLGILGGMGQPQPGQSQIPGALGDISQLIMLYPFLRQMGGAGGGGGIPNSMIPQSPWGAGGPYTPTFPMPRLGVM